MQITLKHMNAEEAWQHILQTYKLYQLKLKKFNYSPNGFIPNDIRMYEMFQITELSDEQIQHYHDIFITATIFTKCFLGWLTRIRRFYIF